MALMLREIGVREAYAIVGGYAAWQARNYPIVTGEHPKYGDIPATLRDSGIRESSTSSARQGHSGSLYGCPVTSHIADSGSQLRFLVIP